MANPSSVPLVVAASLILAMALRILPWPLEWSLYNPDWVLLVLVYWNMAIPDRVGVGTAWFAGLLTDALTGRLLGQHALAYALVAYVCIRLHRRLRLYPLSQQAFMVLGFQLASQLLIFWTQSVKYSAILGGQYWLSSLVGTLTWPLVFVLLRRVRRHFNIF